MREEIRMQHDPATVKRLAGVQFKTFSAVWRFLLFALSLFLILLGFGLIHDFGVPARYFFLALGCILLVNVDASASIKADKTLQAIRQQGGVFPCTKMVFSDSSVRITEEGGKSHTLKYADILRLAEDGQYFYLFITTEAAYMVPKDQLKDADAFREQLTFKSKKNFIRHSGFFSLRLRDITQAFKK